MTHVGCRSAAETDTHFSIVFSFWKRSIDLVGKLFNEEGIPFGRVDGDVDPPRRRKILEEFHSNHSLRVLVMTIGTGAVG
jgi:SWI/SNF-related matrix-associated actin-dependent regulator of chromatin subfamily A3